MDDCANNILGMGMGSVTEFVALQPSLRLYVQLSSRQVLLAILLAWPNADTE